MNGAKGRLVAALLLTALLGFLYLETLEWRDPAWLLPRVAAGFGLCLCVLEALVQVYKIRSAARRPSSDVVDSADPGAAPPDAVAVNPGGAAQVVVEDEVETASVRDLGVALSWVLGYLAAIVVLGFAFGGAVASFAYAAFGAQRRWWIAALLGVGVFVLARFVFQAALGVELPGGLLVPF